MNKKGPYEINYNESSHAFALQRSKYIIIDDNLAKNNMLENYLIKYMT